MKLNTNKKILAIVEARMKSSRLPGKVILPLGENEESINLKFIVSRLQNSKYINQIIIATTENKEDEAITNCLGDNSLVFKGSEEDVFDRVLSAARVNCADLIVEITGDCPFVDYKLIDYMVELLEVNNLDYIANNFFPSYADGFDIQVMKRSTLEALEKMDLSVLEREHVTMRIRQEPGNFRTLNLVAPEEFRRPNYSVTLDTPEDYNVIRTVYREMLRMYGSEFGIQEITIFLDSNPEIVSLNSSIARKGFT